MTLPSWMTQGDNGASAANAAHAPASQYGHYSTARDSRNDHHAPRDARQFEDAPPTHEKRSLDRRSSRDRSPKRSRHDRDRRDRRRSRSRSSGRKHRSR